MDLMMSHDLFLDSLVSDGAVLPPYSHMRKTVEKGLMGARKRAMYRMGSVRIWGLAHPSTTSPNC
jgi:hypothetical protein